MGCSTSRADRAFLDRFRLRRSVYRLRLLAVTFFVGFLFSVSAPGQTPEDPLSENDRSDDAVVREIWQIRSADQAQKMGFSSIAANTYREILANLPEEDERRERLRLSYAATLIAEGQFDEAAAVLDQCEQKEAPAYRLRRAVLDWQAQRWEELEKKVDELAGEDLAETERGWLFFLQGLVADHAGGSREEVEAVFSKAFEHAVSARQQGAFMLGHYRARLFAGEATPELAAELKAKMEEFSGQTAGFRFAQQYAIVLDQIGQSAEATKVIREQIQRVPSAERELTDQFLLLDGLISGAESGQGRESLRTLLEAGTSRNLQRIALQQLAGAVTDENHAFLEGLLTRLIEAGHSLLEELHLYRAQLTLRQASAMASGEERTAKFEQATGDAELLLTRYPGSRLKPEAFEVLAASAWEQRRYRTAANYLTQLREELPTEQRRGEVGLLIADSYFRAGEVNRAVEDYRNAADAYGTVFRDHTETISPGLLLYQRVLAEIRGERMEQARRHLDEIPHDVTIEPVFRWQAEWNFVKAMQQRGQMEEAYARVTSLLAEENTGGLILDELRVRLEWLQAQLSFDAGKPEETIPLVNAVLERVEGETAPIEEPVRDRIVSYSLLLRGQAQLATGQPEEALKAFQQVRERFPQSDPAVYSILVEARYYMQVNRTVDAQQLLTSLADTHRESQYAPIALYEAALNAQRRGQDAAYQDQAIALLERIVDEYPGHEMAFYARLHQGDLLRQLNRFEAAEVVYLSIENRFPNHPDISLVQLALADSYLAQAGQNGRPHFENAVSILERLLDLPSVSPDLRAEAGFKLAFANARRDQTERAQQIYWTAISNLYLDENNAARLGSRGRYWIARCLLESGQHFERAGRLDEARNAYAIIAEGGLPGGSLAAANLHRLTPTEHLQ